MLGIGGRGVGSEAAEEQMDRPGGRGSTGCDTDTDIRADGGGGTGEGGKESAANIPPAKARRDAFI